jgi:hypothetical protein
VEHPGRANQFADLSHRSASTSLTGQVLMCRRMGERIEPPCVFTQDHDDFGLVQSKIMNVIDSKDLEHFQAKWTPVRVKKMF